MRERGDCPFLFVAVCDIINSIGKFFLRRTDINMDFGNVLIVDDIGNRLTKPIFDDFDGAWGGQNHYDTMLFQDAYTIKCDNNQLNVSLYIVRMDPIDYMHKCSVARTFITMSELKKYLGGYIGGNLSGGKGAAVLKKETIQIFADYSKDHNVHAEANITLPLDSRVAIEARGISNWQGRNRNFYEVVAVKYAT